MTIANAPIRALRAFAYSLDGVRLTAVVPGEEVSLRAGAAQGLVAEGYAVWLPDAASAEAAAPAAARPAATRRGVRRA